MTMIRIQTSSSQRRTPFSRGRGGKYPKPPTTSSKNVPFSSTFLFPLHPSLCHLNHKCHSISVSDVRRPRRSAPAPRPHCQAQPHPWSTILCQVSTSFELLSCPLTHLRPLYRCSVRVQVGDYQGGVSDCEKAQKYLRPDSKWARLAASLINDVNTMDDYDPSDEL